MAVSKKQRELDELKWYKSIELSADAPVRPPYNAYMQGALTYAHGRCGMEGALAHMVNQGFISL